jgi:hypothetical protein
VNRNDDRSSITVIAEDHSKKQEDANTRVTLKRLIELEKQFGGHVSGVKRKKMSPHDPRTLAQINKGGQRGGDRMIPNLHNYGRTYETILGMLQEKNVQIKNVAEIGILKGSGVATWSALFPDATIHGFDINLDNTKNNMDFLKSRGAFKTNNLVLHQFDQFEPIIPTKENYQFIIDDGFHNDETVENTFEAFRPWLQKDGIYVVEDCKCEKFRQFLKLKYKNEYLVSYVENEYKMSAGPSQMVIITNY